MKRKISSIFFAAVLAVTGISGVYAVPAFAEEDSDEAAETETFEIAVNEDGGTATLVNDSDVSIQEPAYTPGSDENANGTLVVTEQDGTVHTFEDIELDEGSSYTILEKIGFLYVTDPQDEDVWYYEDAPEMTLDTPVTMYALTDVNIREEMDTSSESLGQAQTGSEVEVAGGAPEWLKVTQGDVSGYIAARYLTADEEDLQEAQEEDATRTEAEEAALAAAEEAAGGSEDASVYDDADAYASDAGGYYYDDADAYASDAGGYYYDDADAYASDAGDYASDTGDYTYDDADAYASDAGGYTYEAVYDCDGSGNGYYEITDAEGNVTYEDF